MTATQRDLTADGQQRVALGVYVRDGVDHTIVAIRDDGEPWGLLDTTDRTTMVIESFYPDEDIDAVRAVADLYVAEMRA